MNKCDREAATLIFYGSAMLRLQCNSNIGVPMEPFRHLTTPALPYHYLFSVTQAQKIVTVIFCHL